MCLGAKELHDHLVASLNGDASLVVYLFCFDASQKVLRRYLLVNLRYLPLWNASWYGRRSIICPPSPKLSFATHRSNTPMDQQSEADSITLKPT